MLGVKGKGSGCVLTLIPATPQADKRFLGDKLQGLVNIVDLKPSHITLAMGTAGRGGHNQLSYPKGRKDRK